MIVGTAGHIDHGKTSLVRALTGRDTDRLPEEKRRGITIELGYAFLDVPGAGRLAFVDVPGHERFVHTMVSGATGVDLALLVIAADDGVMPQTREHLDILALLGVSRGLVALTKCDAVDEARRAAARDEVRRFLVEGGVGHWPVHVVSSRTGEGVAELAEALVDLAREAGEGEVRGRFRLAVDRSFSLQGVGTVVTGTVHDGIVREGDEVRIAPGGATARVRSIHAQDRPAKQARRGERCALNLAGLSRDEVPRGAWVQDATLGNDCERFDATLAISRAEARVLASSSLVHLHHGSRDVLARVGILDAASARPGERVLATIATVEPLALCKGDRFVIRDASAQRTIGGGVAIDADPPARHRRAPARLALLSSLRDGAPSEAFEALLAAAPVTVARWASAWNLDPPAQAALLERAGARIVAGTAFHPGTWRSLRDATLVAVGATHEREPEMPGVEQDRLRRMVAAKLEPEAFAGIAGELLAEGVLVRRGAFLALPGHKAELAGEERVRWERLKPLLMDAPYGPPRVRDLAKLAGIPETEVRSLLRKVARLGEVTLIAQDHFFLSEAVAELADIAAAVAGDEGAARAAPFRDRIGGGRKVAIHILEFFDRIGYTRRVRDDHLPRRPNPWKAEGPGATG